MTKPKEKGSILLSALDNYGGQPFDEIFNAVYPVYLPKDVQLAFDLVEKPVLIIWGGEDISPSIYGQKAIPQTSATDYPSSRDRLEMDLAHKAIELGIPIIGICRGAQLMCALSGGKLIQHVNGHGGGYHDIITHEGKKLSCPSLHHQMMWPWAEGVEHEMLAWPPQNRSNEYLGGDTKEGLTEKLTLPGPEPEVVWFPKTKCLAIQSHPEFIHTTEHPFVKYCLALTQKYCLG